MKRFAGRRLVGINQREERLAASAATLAKALVSTMLGILKSNFGIEMPPKLARRGRNLSRPSRVYCGF